MKKPNVSRRQFIKTAGAGATAISVAALTGDDARAAVAAPPPQKWDEETDVLVVGFGGGGSIAAIEAADAGANVLILEKNPADRHICNTNVCDGGFTGPISTSPEDLDNVFKYMKSIIGDTVDDDELLRAWCRETAVNHVYLKKLAEDVGLPSEITGGKTGHGEYPEVPGSHSITGWEYKAGPGLMLFHVMEKNVQARKNIRVEFSSPAKRIIQGNNREVLGIIAERNGREIAVRGRRATILACGGFEYNKYLQLNSFFGRPRFFYGTDSNTGDGVFMSMAAGADIWHMNWASQHFGFHYKDFPVGMTGFNAFTGRTIGEAVQGHAPEPGFKDPKWSFMIVDQYGKRFFNEGYHGHSSYLYFCYFDPAVGAYPRLPSYVIFDETLRTAGEPLSTNEMRGGPFGSKTRKYDYFWSKDQSKEIARGWIMKADTLEELAKKINERQGPNPIQDYFSSIKMDPKVLLASVDKFNEYARQGSDPDFGRTSFGAIEKGPFYATEVWACGPNTQGGPRYNAKGQVVDPYRKPIPRLYKAGELGSIWGERYNGGGNIAEVLAFGRVAGQNAAREEPQA